MSEQDSTEEVDEDGRRRIMVAVAQETHEQFKGGPAKFVGMQRWLAACIDAGLAGRLVFDQQTEEIKCVEES